ncbi:tRNA (N6-isopentenyl adenosine(37)-C2)-methylthiotransferase MiaB [Candidatus Parcubacteria bacterium]|nr:tRNA (N6-isopentenyl adenosine(37)-C2)-methylthiotransferase MiaB [Candidatus Parcubacteria bacterium]
MSSPTYHLITFGCQMNKNDSQRISSLLRGIGFEPTERKEQADLVLINTCSVRQSAEDRVYSLVGTFGEIKRARPEMILGVTGCMPGRDRDGAIKKRLSFIDLYFPTAEMGQLPRWIAELRPELVNSADIVEDYLKITPDRLAARQAFVSIQTGCNKFCTYCVVPFARGLEKNRSLRDILDEVRELAEHGCVEVTLLGQTVNSYRAPDPEAFSKANPYVQRSFGPLGGPHDDGMGRHFAGLLWEINQIAGISRLHFTAPHPLHMSDEVMDAMTLPAHLQYLHLPVQSGDDEVLRRMNRRYTAAQYLDVVDRLRAHCRAMAIGTDIIVGFSGESEAAFERTVELYERVGFDLSYTARYSVRSGTAAWRAFKDDVSREEKKRRWDVLQAVQERITRDKNEAYVGKTVSVLVERHEPPKITEELLSAPEDIRQALARQSGFCYGNSREMKLVRFVGGAEMVGKIVDVQVKRADTWLLEGSLCAQKSF